MALSKMLKSKWLKILIFPLIILVIQILPIKFPKTNNSEPKITLDKNISSPLLRACGDCHSMKPNLPWYFKVQPISQIIYYDIENGRNVFIFDEWDNYSAIKKFRILEKSLRLIKNGEMPPSMYKFLNSDIQFKKEEIEKLSEFISQQNQNIDKRRGWIP